MVDGQSLRPNMLRNRERFLPKFPANSKRDGTDAEVSPQAIAGQRTTAAAGKGRAKGDILRYLDGFKAESLIHTVRGPVG